MISFMELLRTMETTAFNISPPNNINITLNVVMLLNDNDFNAPSRLTGLLFVTILRSELNQIIILVNDECG